MATATDNVTCLLSHAGERSARSRSKTCDLNGSQCCSWPCDEKKKTQISGQQLAGVCLKFRVRPQRDHRKQFEDAKRPPVSTYAQPNGNGFHSDVHFSLKS